MVALLVLVMTGALGCGETARESASAPPPCNGLAEINVARFPSPEQQEAVIPASATDLVPGDLVALGEVKLIAAAGPAATTEKAKSDQALDSFESYLARRSELLARPEPAGADQPRTVSSEYVAAAGGTALDLSGETPVRRAMATAENPASPAERPSAPVAAAQDLPTAAELSRIGDEEVIAFLRVPGPSRPADLLAAGGVLEAQSPIAVLEESAPAAPESATDETSARLTEEERRFAIQRQARAAEARALVERGKQLFELSRYEEAFAQFEKARNLDPDFASAREWAQKARGLVKTDTLGTVEMEMRKVTERYEIEREMSRVRLRSLLGEAEKLLERAKTRTPEKAHLGEEEFQNVSLGEASRGLGVLDRFDLLLPTVVDESVAQSELQQRSQALRTALTAERDRIRAALDTESRQRALAVKEEARQQQDASFNKKIESLMETARFHLGREEYEKARDLAQRVMEMDPNYAPARTLRNQARDLLAQAETDKTRREIRQATDEWIVEVDELSIPENEIVRYPKNWDEIKERAQRGLEGESKSAWEQAMLDKLQNQRITFEFNDMYLRDAIAIIRGQAHINIVLDETVDPEMPVNLSVRDMTLGKALDWILKLTNLYREMRNEALFISVEPKGDIIMRLYPVFDLTQRIPDHYGPIIESAGDDDDDGGLGGLFGEAVGGFEGGEGGQVDLIGDIQRSIAPASWDESRGVSIGFWQDNLLILQAPAVHAQIAEYLNKLRASQKQQVLVEGYFVEVVENFFEEIGFTWFDNPNITQGDSQVDGVSIQEGLAKITNFAGGNLGVGNQRSGGRFWDSANNTWFYQRDVTSGLAFAPGSGTVGPDSSSSAINAGQTGGARIRLKYVAADFLHNFEVNALLTAIRNTQKGTILHQPRLLVANGHNAYVEIATVTSYISEYEVDQGYHIPVIDQYRQGIVFDVRPVISFDKKYVTVRLRPSMLEYDPARSREQTINVYTAVAGEEGGTRLVAAVSLTEQHPLIKETRVSTYATIPDRGSVMIGGLFRDNRTQGGTRVPFLSDLPLVGRLARSDQQNREKHNVVLMVGTTIVELD